MQPDFPSLEQGVLKFWEKKKVLQKYLHKNDKAKKRFSFLDGPITANNPMGVHHAWGRTLKDLYQRYKNMRGFKQRFQNGFDNQGLWVEVEVEKKLGFKSKKDIEKFGVAKFVKECKKHTRHFARIQTEQSKRLGYFMDWDNSYYTLSDENNYAIWHFFKKVWQDGNLYKGRDSVPWCPRCGTAISQHEILTEEYQELTHDSVFLKFPIIKRPGLANPQGMALLVWTTTPWTIPGNIALAVNPKTDYVAAKLASPKKGGTDAATTILAKSCLSAVGGPYEIVGEFKGSELEGLEYEGPFDELPAVEKARRENPKTFHTVVLSKDLVFEEEGTGVVHIATGCGTEDFRLGKEVGLPVIDLIDEGAVYHDGLGKLSNQNAKEHPELVFDYLKEHENGRFLYKIEPCIHRYPVCWRCKSELVWRVVDEWYVAMDDRRHPNAKNYRRRLMEVIKDVRWIPSFGYDRELDWLRNMEDWLISKKRYWGLALPIWGCKCGHFEVIGSKGELQKRAIEGWEDFEGQTPHRPWVDAVKVKCQACGELANRIPDVGNPWLDAGIVSFSTLKYFEDRGYWQDWFPVDLVLESFPGQFKNWFYSLLTMSVVLEDRTPFKVLLGHGLVRDEHGEEMHKSKGNAIEFGEAAERMGADVMRWMYCRQNPALNLNFGYGPADEIKRRFLLIWWNCGRFFTGNAGADGWTPRQKNMRPTGRLSVLDSWILSRLNQVVKTVTESLDNFDHVPAVRALENFILDDLSAWYVRRSRDRIGPTTPEGKGKLACYQTLYKVLVTVNRLLCPFMPFISETLHQHLVSGSISARPGLASARSVHLEDWPEVDEALVDEKLEKQMELVREIVEKGHAQRKAAGLRVRQPLALLKISNLKSQISNEEESVRLIKDELNIKEVDFVEGKGELAVELDTKITPELRAEGEAREMARQIQKLRKEKGCRLNDRISVVYPSVPLNEEAVKLFGDYICGKTLAVKLESGKAFKINEVLPAV